MIAVMQFGDWGVEASEAIRVTESGSELFCNMSKEFMLNKLLDYQSNKCFKHAWLTITS